MALKNFLRQYSSSKGKLTKSKAADCKESAAEIPKSVIV
tara:strand:+ start:99 stop:215 length:117 start_codon:yes stop_codon:yes gene_type:complete